MVVFLSPADCGLMRPTNAGFFCRPPTVGSYAPLVCRSFKSSVDFDSVSHTRVGFYVPPHGA